MGFPCTMKRKRQGRAVGNKKNMNALHEGAEVHQVAKERAYTTTTNRLASKNSNFSVNQHKSMPHSLPKRSDADMPKRSDSGILRLAVGGTSKLCDSDLPKPSDDDLVDFKGLAILPQCYGSLLERACIRHPELATCPKRSLRWREFAYETLGELLYFLTSTRQREMAPQAREHLAILWEEAQGLGFDLRWLARVVNSCLVPDSSSSVLEKLTAALETKKNQKNTLHCQLTTLTMQMIEVDRKIHDLQQEIQDVKDEQEQFLFTGL